MDKKLTALMAKLASHPNFAAVRGYLAYLDAETWTAVKSKSDDIQNFGPRIAADVAALSSFRLFVEECENCAKEYGEAINYGTVEDAS